MARWKIEEDKNGYIHVREDKNGPYTTKDDALKKARSVAKENKTILRVHGLNSGYESSDYTNILLPDEWVNKLNSEVKICRAEYMIAKTKVKDLKTTLNQAKKKNDEPLMLSTKNKINDAILRKRKIKLNYKEAKKRLKEAKKKS